MTEQAPFTRALPPAARPAVAVVRRLVAARHEALLAGGCVRDLLLGWVPNDYDVATDAPPERVRELFPATRLVGVQFGVVLVRQRERWVEVATFRTESAYSDGRHPAEVRFATAREDAQRRDFTVNGMFLDPMGRMVLDYVGGQADLRARLIRAIGVPRERFEEDHLRLLRAVRFAARLAFPIEPVTWSAMRALAPKLGRVAAERIREELEKMLGHPHRLAALRMLHEAGLLAHLWLGAAWSAEQVAAAQKLLAALPESARFEPAFAALLADRPVRAVHEVARALNCSNEQRETLAWLVQHQADLDRPDAIALADLKRLLAHPALPHLRLLARARWADWPDGNARAARLAARIAAVPPEAIQPPPLVTGEDVAALGVRPGPVYKRVLDALYTQQLDEVIRTRPQALQVLRNLLHAEGVLT
jgi:poly(A) polymerase